MPSLVETPNLGPVTVSKHVIRHFSKQFGDDARATEEVERILQSAEIEQLEVPAMIASLMSSNGDDPNALEFWVHPGSSTVFLVKPQENGKLVDMVIKQSMTDFVFSNS